MIYLVVIGTLLKFSLDRAATDQLFYALVVLGILFSLWTSAACQIHYNSARALAVSLLTLASDNESPTHAQDGKRFCQIIIFLQIFNLFVTVIFIVLLFLGPEVVINTGRV